MPTAGVNGWCDRIASNFTWTLSNAVRNKDAASYPVASDLPNTGNVTKGKRKRPTQSPRSSPAQKPNAKKLKATADPVGAVQVAPESYVHNAERIRAVKGMSVIAPKPVGLFAPNGSININMTGNMPLQGAGLSPYIKHADMMSTVTPSPSPSPLAAASQPMVSTMRAELLQHARQNMVAQGQYMGHGAVSAPPVVAHSGAKQFAPALSPTIPHMPTFEVAAPTQRTSPATSVSTNLPPPKTTATANVTPPAPAASCHPNKPQLHVLPDFNTTAGAPNPASCLEENIATAPVLQSQISSAGMVDAAPLDVKIPVPTAPTNATQASPETSADKAATAKPKAEVNQDHLRAIIEVEINAAIIFKHNELRLIEQEIAKCQVGLEQLRRCQIIPFPGSDGLDLNIATHSNPSIVAPTGMTIPAYPAPWGATDGPYTRHYASWLLPSSAFDPRLPEVNTPAASPFPRDGRVTRGSGVDVTPLATYASARTSRATGGRLRQSIDTQSPMQQRDPLVIKRNQDGQWVKLYCTQCKPERSDFANVQGFLNHCRISHKLDYKSHEAAAIACGRVVQPNESFLQSEPSSARELSAKSGLVGPISTDGPLVHPLARPTTKMRVLDSPLQQIVPRSFNPSGSQATGLSTPTTPTVPANFKPSSETPYLSKLMAQSGFAGDMSARVMAAKVKVDLSVYSDSESDEEPVNKRSDEGRKKVPTARGGHAKPPVRRIATAHPPSRKPLATRPTLPALPPLVAPSPSAATASLPTPDMTGISNEMDLSPHTADSNPGLVSDREDFEDEDEMDVDVATNPSRRDSDMDVKIEDGEGEDEPTSEVPQSFCAPRTPAN